MRRRTELKRGNAGSAGAARRLDPRCGCSSHRAQVLETLSDFVAVVRSARRCEDVTISVLAQRRFKITICRGPECGERRGSAALLDAFQSALRVNGLEPYCELAWQSCFGRCTQGPNVLVREVAALADPGLGSGFATSPGPRGVTALYNRMDGSRVKRVVVDHVVGGEIVREFIERPGILYSQPVGSKEKDSS